MTKTDEKSIFTTPRMEIVKVSYANENGNATLTHTIIKSKPSVAVIVKNEGKIAFIKQFRSTTGKTYIEIPAGLIEKGESEIEASVREVEEETGIIVNNVQILVKGPSLLDPSKSDENYGVTVANMGNTTESHLDEMEQIDENIIWLKEKFVFNRVQKQLFNGEEFYQGHYLSGHSLYALMAYMINK